MIQCFLEPHIANERSCRRCLLIRRHHLRLCSAFKASQPAGAHGRFSETVCLQREAAEQSDLVKVGQRFYQLERDLHPQTKHGLSVQLQARN